MFGLIRRYTRWLHTRWPAGHVETLPAIADDLSCNVPGVYVVGDLTGIPLLKFSADTGARAVREIVDDTAFADQREKKSEGVLDLLIIGAGVGGMSAALEASSQGLEFAVYESNRRFQTIADFPRAKPIYTYPTDFEPAGTMHFRADVKEDLLEELRQQTADIEVTQGHVESVGRAGGLVEARLDDGGTVRALRTIVAIGRSGNFRKLGVPGEELDKVYNRLHDPADFAGKNVLVVGGGDSALETAIALTRCGADVTLSYRRKEFQRPKPDNVEKLKVLAGDASADVDVEEPVSERVSTAAGPFQRPPERPGSLRLATGTRIKAIRDKEVVLEDDEGTEEALANDVVFSMIGREAPLDFLRKSHINLVGETRGIQWAWVVGFFAVVVLLYAWKNDLLLAGNLFPERMPDWIGALGSWWSAQVGDRSTLVGTIAVSMKSRSFYYTLLYTLAVGVFGIARIRRRRTPYVTVQTITLFLVQALPLFLLPEVILPWLGYNGVFDSGAGASIGNALFERYIPEDAYLAHDWPEWGHPRAYWRAYGLVLAWPLMVYNVFTHEPIAAWLVISVLQTFVIIPVIVWHWGKGAYCGWICSCGGLAETVGDTLRQRMPHGPFWNRLNMVGQALLGAALLLLVVRILGWIWPGSWMGTSFDLLLDGNPLSWKWTVDVMLAGVLGVGLYIKYSGRVWCRFACPLAALMHIYARFTRFRILADKKKCISCNVCTSVCHQGIDIMNFANKGLPMEDPECVRCSACVQACPTGVLSFGRVDREGKTIAVDSLAASPVQMRESGQGRSR